MRASFGLCLLGAALSTLCSEAKPRWLRRTGPSFADALARLDRGLSEAQTSEQILVEQLRQMRVTHGELRETLRASLAESAEALANATRYAAELEAEVSQLKIDLAAVEAARAAADTAAARTTADAALAATRAEVWFLARRRPA
ncbi:hypothetical protein M885DRAFT_494465 [Pelagophyceae sp. CCMP2097]|nr:hypothetical protein M885DRAFT_494465 [Pelagophyceae sp. CCMP2097]